MSSDGKKAVNKPKNTSAGARGASSIPVVAGAPVPVQAPAADAGTVDLADTLTHDEHKRFIRVVETMGFTAKLDLRKALPAAEIATIRKFLVHWRENAKDYIDADALLCDIDEALKLAAAKFTNDPSFVPDDDDDTTGTNGH
jgi:hypothetical protein